MRQNFAVAKAGTSSSLDHELDGRFLAGLGGKFCLEGETADHKLAPWAESRDDAGWQIRVKSGRLVNTFRMSAFGGKADICNEV
jgi:hypothetical protein